ncbi:cytoplasmic dynein 1 intermediate chain 2 isoform X1 [Hydra vulgaris]|uniref:Cytoplasmic dynein 1 intermediate chain 2 n=1 Tax=Hydra vulgaris TaxID=6087 RepID=T2ME57_HYDVU|nr:cytoplasmic dynein 1 intermediate chain 2 [Hydra vulgaris]
MADRKAELENKRKRLEEMRRIKEERNKKTGVSPSRAAKKVDGSSAFSDSGSSTNEIDSIFKELDLPSSSSIELTQARLETCSIDSGSQQSSPPPARKSVVLSISHREPISFAPKELVRYTKETQTVVTKEESPEPEVVKVEVVKKEVLQEEKEKKKEEVPKMVELSEEVKSQIMNSQDFLHFFDHAARIIEKAISEDDYVFDYGAVKDEGESESVASKKLALNRQFFDERWSKHRCVTCMDWSQLHPELLVASYNQNELSPQDPDGVALIWNMKYHKQTPEYIFHNQSAIMSVCFAQFHPNLLVGGSYSGQIVLWDNRSRKRAPVQKTPLSAAAHTHPVYCVEVVGTLNAHNLITFSTDGKMCSWSLDMLSQPQEVMDLQHTHTKPVSVTSASFQPGDVNNFVVGSEDGSIYSAQRHGSKAGIVEQFDGHHGPVTSIDYNAVPGPIDFSHLFLTSSFDWTIRLWSNKSTKVLYSFEDNGDYVLDTQWSPINPALFAAVDGMGRLDLWNLNNDTEVPTSSITIASNSAINRVKWSGSGLQLAAGDDEGHIYVYDVGEQLAVPRSDEWARFANTLQDIQANNQAITDIDRPLSPTNNLAANLISPPRM